MHVSCLILSFPCPFLKPQFTRARTPAFAKKRSGSLTTPPCTEGVLWHLLTTPVKVSPEQLFKFQTAVGDTVCNVTDAEPARRRRLAGVYDNYLERTAAGTPRARAAAAAAAVVDAQEVAAAAAAPAAARVASRGGGVPDLLATRGGEAAVVGGFQFPALDAEGCRKLANTGNYRGEWARGQRIGSRERGALLAGASGRMLLRCRVDRRCLLPRVPTLPAVPMRTRRDRAAVDQPLNGRQVRIWVDTTPCAKTLAQLAADSPALAQLLGPTSNASAPISISGYDFAVAANPTGPCPATGSAGAAAASAMAVAFAAVLALLL
jgi:hypothetical protein